jgi:ATP-dependent helicase/nuclease subunit A
VAGYLAVNQRGSFQPQPLALAPAWEDREEAEQEFCNAEALRLRYVAATRAGTALIISQRGSYQNRNPWRLFEAHLSDAPAIEDPGHVPVPRDGGTRIEAPEVEQAARAVEERLAAGARPSYRVLGAKAYALSGTEKEDAAAVEPAPPLFSDLPEGEHGVEWGVVIHALLDLKMKNPDADLHRFAGALLAENNMDRALAGAAAETVEKVTQSEIWRRAGRSGQRYTEMPFQMPGREQAPPAILRGTIDLIFREAGGWVLVDYKTDVVTDRTLTGLIRKYTPQLEIYEAAWETCTGEKVKEKGLYFVRIDKYRPL